MDNLKIMLGPFLLTVIMVSIAQGAYAGGEPMLYPITKDGLWGYMNAKGETVVSPKYKTARLLVACFDPSNRLFCAV